MLGTVCRLSRSPVTEPLLSPCGAVRLSCWGGQDVSGEEQGRSLQAGGRRSVEGLVLGAGGLFLLGGAGREDAEVTGHVQQ